MKSKIKWIKSRMKQIFVGVAVIIIVALIYVALVMRYANREAGELAHYAQSIEELPEVERVMDMHRFNGMESYVVAHVLLSDGQEFYYFVREETVEHYVASDELMEEERVLAIMQRAILDYNEDAVEVDLIGIQLGMINNEVVFEVRVRLNEQIHYVVINGEDGEVVLHFNH